MRLKIRTGETRTYRRYQTLLSGLAAFAITLSIGGTHDAFALDDADFTVSGSAPLCALSMGLTDDDVESFGPPSAESLKVMSWITGAIGIEMNFSVLRAKFTRSPIAFATIRDGKRYVVYDEDRLRVRNSATSWFDIAVLSHEIGHHIQGHTAVKTTDDWTKELEADRFAGFAIGRLGGTLDQALMITTAFTSNGSATHPPRKRRAAAIKQGWHQAQTGQKALPAACRPRWAGEEFEADGISCRTVRDCKDGQQRLRRACLEDGDAWRWSE